MIKEGLIILLLSLVIKLSFGQSFQRFDKESPEQFSTRLKPDNSTIAYRIIDTIWNKTPVIIAFYQQSFRSGPVNDSQEYQRIISTIFVKRDSLYNKCLIDTIGPEGGDPEIRNVFFANANKDMQKELIILTSWYQHHYDFGGTLYGTFIYNNLTDSTQKKLVFMKTMSSQLDGGCDCSFRNGREEKAKFKTAGAIVKKLTQLGFKQ